MRLAIVCPYAWDVPGGVQTHVRALAAALRGRGHEVWVVAPRLSRSAAGEDQVVFAGRCVKVPANGSIAPIAFGPAARRHVNDALGSIRPDVVHLHEPLAPSISFLALLGTNLPAVGTFHASASRSAGYAAAKPVLERAIRRLTVRTVVSEAARDLVARYFPGTYELTPNGIDLGPFKRGATERVVPEPSLLFLNRIERRKGLEVLIQAMTRLRDTKATLVVAGSGPDERKLRRLAAALGVDAVWLGRVEHDRVPAVYAGCDVYCAPALGGESFGIVLLEAMAAGTPVVCSDLAAFQAVVSDAGLITAAGNAGDLADGLRQLLTRPDLRAELASRGLRRAEEFSWDRLVPHVEALYDRALAKV